MHQPLTILYTPLPQSSIHDLRIWRCAFDAALAPWLDARQQEHVRRFGQNATGQNAAGQSAAGQSAAGSEIAEQEVVTAALSRLVARAQLITAAAPFRAGAQQIQITMDTRGRPRLDGWRVAFSHSGRAAFCALAPAGQSADIGQDAPDIGRNSPASGLEAPDIGLDAEALTSAPPHASAFAAKELAAPPPLPQTCIDREALRRWTIKEALLKAAGLGLGMQPAQIPTGGFGQRAGLWQGPLGTFGWRSLACPGHWLCVALAGGVPPVRITVARQSPHLLLRRLAELPPQG
jgi:4'-phosphopantetheinyl transferase